MSTKPPRPSLTAQTTKRLLKQKRLWVVTGGLIAVTIAVISVVLAIRPSVSGENISPEAALPASTTMGVIELTVADLPAMQQYYVQAVGLEVLSETEGQVVLGADQPVLQLTEGNGDPLVTPTEAGMYHSAILYPDEAALAQVLARIATYAPQSYQGASDHAVSLAFYFSDPEGNGLELYLDTPEETWQWADGEVQMGSAALDPNAFLQQYLPADSPQPTENLALDVDASVGHIHLKVGDLGEAESFYADMLGFAVTARAEGALFYAAGGYHHHVATNVWQSNGAGVRANTTGLGAFTVVLDSDDAVDQVAERLETAGHEYERTPNGLDVVDPWGNTVRIVM